MDLKKIILRKLYRHRIIGGKHTAVEHLTKGLPRHLTGDAKEAVNELIKEGIDVLMDDRDERAGVKFKDADLIGIPFQIILGEKNLKEGLVEIKDRRTKEIKKVTVEVAAGQVS